MNIPPLSSCIAGRRFGSALLAAALTLGIGSADAQTAPAKPQQPDLSGFRPSALEVTLLPRYCWGSFNPQFRGPGMEAFNLPPRSVCGERMNHFCPAIVSINRAKKDTTPQRGYWISVADDHMKYTLNALSEVPGCPLAPEIQRFAGELRTLKSNSWR